ncbi:adenylosuccinate lyase [Elusimicrobiota bacterium]
MISRYFTKEMLSIWSEVNYYRIWQEIEAAVLKARKDEKLAEKVLNIRIEPSDILKKEKESNHELNSFLDILSERIGTGAERIHSGLTSSDIMDTARIIQLNRSLDIICSVMLRVKKLLKEKALQYKSLIMCGKTHGQIAEPITLGLKFLRYLEHFKRNEKRISILKDSISYAKINGAVGTYSLIDPEEEKEVLHILKLQPMIVTSQILPRDIFAQYMFCLSLVAASCAEIALEVRLLTQSGINEISEPFMKTQKGSSAMPHKKNPIICERICGLSRLISANVQTALSNITLWNERDISHSSNERIILEDSSVLCHYILKKLEYVIKNIVVHEKNINRNIEDAGIQLFSSGILKLLLNKGVRREEAYSVVKTIFDKKIEGQGILDFINTLITINDNEFREAIDIKSYLSNIDYIYKRAGL